MVNDSTFFQISRGHHANMDLITLAYSGHSKHFEVSFYFEKKRWDC